MGAAAKEWGEGREAAQKLSGLKCEWFCGRETLIWGGPSLGKVTSLHSLLFERLCSLLATLPDGGHPVSICAIEVGLPSSNALRRLQAVADALVRVLGSADCYWVSNYLDLEIDVTVADARLGKGPRRKQEAVGCFSGGQVGLRSVPSALPTAEPWVPLQEPLFLVLFLKPFG